MAFEENQRTQCFHKMLFSGEIHNKRSFFLCGRTKVQRKVFRSTTNLVKKSLSKNSISYDLNHDVYDHGVYVYPEQVFT